MYDKILVIVQSAHTTVWVVSARNSVLVSFDFGSPGSLGERQTTEKIVFFY